MLGTKHYPFCNLILKKYQKGVSHIISSFKVFNINYVLRIGNVATGTLANAVVRLSPLRDDFVVEIFYEPYIPNNNTNLCVFNSD